MYKLFAILRRRPRLLAVGALASVLAGLFNTLLVVSINDLILSDGVNVTRLFMTFGFCLVCLSVFKVIGGAALARLSNYSAYDLRMSLVERLACTPYEQTEPIESEAMTILVNDVSTISQFIEKIPRALVSAVMILGCFIYVIVLAPIVGLILALFLFFVFLFERFVKKRLKRRLQTVRNSWEDIFDEFRATARGLKDLYMNRRKREAFFGDSLKPVAEQLLESQTSARVYQLQMLQWVESFTYLCVISLAVGHSVFGVADDQVLHRLTVIFLFMMTHFRTIHRFTFFVPEAVVALDRTERLISEQTVKAPQLEYIAKPALVEAKSWPVRFEGIRYQYAGEASGSEFTVGPLSFELRQGEIVYLTGGNGSGKSTLLKLMAGLYEPHSGSIVLADMPLSDVQKAAYRENFTAIFNDSFVFKALHGIDDDQVREEGPYWIERFGLPDVLDVEAKRYRQTDLSLGQGRRQALVSALLEQRPILLLDEWTSHQDPDFKKRFHQEILPELKAKGFTIVMATHDEAYFNLADKVIHMVDGQIESCG